MHSPFFRTKSDGEPAELTSIFFNDTILVFVAPNVSDDRTANPSIAELSNEGEGNLALIFFTGSVLGFVAGGIGIGGGIYLVPIIIMFGLGSEKEAAAAGAMFIWLNSLIGVAARTRAGSFDLDFILPLSLSLIHI